MIKSTTKSMTAMYSRRNPPTPPCPLVHTYPLLFTGLHTLGTPPLTSRAASARAFGFRTFCVRKEGSHNTAGRRERGENGVGKGVGEGGTFKPHKMQNRKSTKTRRDEKNESANQPGGNHAYTTAGTHRHQLFNICAQKHLPLSHIPWA